MRVDRFVFVLSSSALRSRASSGFIESVMISDVFLVLVLVVGILGILSMPGLNR